MRRDLVLGLAGLVALAWCLGRAPGPPGPPPCPPAARILVNAASLDTLMLLPGLGPARAGRILAERERGGPFRDEADLARRLVELGPAVHRAILPHLEFRVGTRAGL